MRAMVIDDGVKARIAQALKEAPTIPLEVLRRHGRKARGGNASDPLPLADRTQLEEGWQRPPSAEVLVPHGYRLCISREEQPGLTVLHLSVSVDGKPGMVPSLPAVEMLARECGAVWPPLTGWPEEYDRGRWAVNILAREVKA